MRKHLIIAAAAGAAAFAIPATASANVSAGEVTCTSATFHAFNWAVGAERAWSLEVGSTLADALAALLADLGVQAPLRPEARP